MSGREHDQFEVIWHGDVAVLTLAESHSPSKLRADLLAFIETNSPLKIVINHGERSFCSTAMNGYFVEVSKRCAERGSQIRFCGVIESARGIYSMFLEKIIPIDDSMAEAIAAFQDDERHAGR